MLVLSRKCGEDIVIAENIKVRVLEIKGDRVKLGFDAPKEISIDRLEVRNEKMAPSEGESVGTA